MTNSDLKGMYGVTILTLLLTLPSCHYYTAAREERQEAFTMAAYNGDVEEMKTLIEKGADVNAPSGFESHKTNPPLIIAVGKGKIEAVQLLLDHGADVNVRGHAELTPIIGAAWMGHTEIVKLLIKSGADVNVVYEGQTALEIAQAKGHVEVVKLLR